MQPSSTASTTSHTVTSTTATQTTSASQTTASQNLHISRVQSAPSAEIQTASAQPISEQEAAAALLSLSATSVAPPASTATASSLTLVAVQPTPAPDTPLVELQDSDYRAKVAERLALAGITDLRFKIPTGWARLTEQQRQFFLDDILERYNNGQSRQSMANMYSQHIYAINGVLLLNPALNNPRLRSSADQIDYAQKLGTVSWRLPTRLLNEELKEAITSSKREQSSKNQAAKRKKLLPASSASNATTSSGITQRAIQPKPSQEPTALVPVMINNMVYFMPQGALTLLNQPQPVFAPPVFTPPVFTPTTQSTPAPSKATSPSKKPRIGFAASQADETAASTFETARAQTPTEDQDSEGKLVIDLDAESPKSELQENDSD